MEFNTKNGEIKNLCANRRATSHFPSIRNG